MKKIINFLILGSILGLVLLGLAFFERKNQNLEVTFFDVGQGDAILIRTPEKQNILIDGGPDSKVLEKLGKFLPFYDRKIDLLILSHPHADHVTGLVGVLDRYQVDEILLSGVVHTSSEYLKFLKNIRGKEITTKIAQSNQSINTGNCQIKVLYPFESLKNQKITDLNDSSIVLKLNFGKISFLFPGDISTEKENELVFEGIDLNSDILKVAHQGSKNSTGQLFLKNVTPEIAVISVGTNKFGHPHQETLERLKKAGVKIKRTDIDGDIQIISDGQNFWLK